MSVLFCDEDTPGSSLAGRNPAELKNEEIRFSLKCRRDLGKGLRTVSTLIMPAIEWVLGCFYCSSVYGLSLFVKA